MLPAINISFFCMVEKVEMIFVIPDTDSSTDIVTSKVNYFALGNTCGQELSQVF